MKWIKKYSPIIAGILMLLLVFKSCQSCSRSRTVEWNQQTYEIILDSIQADRWRAWDSVKTLNHQVSFWKDKYQTIQYSLDYTQKQNSSLVETIQIRYKKDSI